MEDDDLYFPRLITIAELAHKHNVSLRSIRFYEAIGLMRPTRIGSHRLFSPRDDIHLQLILTGKRLGLTLREIKRMFDDRASQRDSDPRTIYDLLDLRTVEKQLALLQKQRCEVEAAIATLRASLERDPNAEHRGRTSQFVVG